MDLLFLQCFPLIPLPCFAWIKKWRCKLTAKWACDPIEIALRAQTKNLRTGLECQIAEKPPLEVYVEGFVSMALD